MLPIFIIAPFYPKIEKTTWSDITIRYVEAFVAARYPIRLMSAYGSVDFTDPESRWRPYSHLFDGETPTTDNFTCLVVGHARDLTDPRKAGGKNKVVHHVDAKYNVILTANFPMEYSREDIVALDFYNYVITPTASNAEFFKRKHVNAIWLPPESAKLAAWFGVLT